MKNGFPDDMSLSMAWYPISSISRGKPWGSFDTSRALKMPSSSLIFKCDEGFLNTDISNGSIERNFIFCVTLCQDLVIGRVTSTVNDLGVSGLGFSEVVGTGVFE